MSLFEDHLTDFILFLAEFLWCEKGKQTLLPNQFLCKNQPTTKEVKRQFLSVHKMLLTSVCLDLFSWISQQKYIPILEGAPGLFSKANVFGVCLLETSSNDKVIETEYTSLSPFFCSWPFHFQTHQPPNKTPNKTTTQTNPTQTNPTQTNQPNSFFVNMFLFTTNQ